MLGSMLISGGSSSKPNDHYCIEELGEEHSQNIQDIQIYSPSQHLSALLADLHSFLAVSVTAVRSLVGDSLYAQEPQLIKRTNEIQGHISLLGTVKTMNSFVHH